jgi:hypothetical protein
MLWMYIGNLTIANWVRVNFTPAVEGIKSAL